MDNPARLGLAVAGLVFLGGVSLLNPYDPWINLATGAAIWIGAALWRGEAP